MGLQLVPPLLVGAVRSLLAAQGVDPSALSASGELDPTGLITMGFDKVEIRTALSPPVVVDLRAKPDPENQKLLKFVQPAVILTGRAGKATIAPFGVPSGISADARAVGANIAVGLVTGVLGAFLLSRFAFRR
jgi:hypothetical protein